MARAPHIIIAVVLMMLINVISVAFLKPLDEKGQKIEEEGRSEMFIPCLHGYVQTHSGDCKEQIKILKSAMLDVNMMKDAETMTSVPCNFGFSRTASGDCSKTISFSEEDDGLPQKVAKSMIIKKPCQKGYVLAASGECKVAIRIL